MLSMQVIRQFIFTVQAGNVRFCLIVDSLCFLGSKLKCKIICCLVMAKGGWEGGGRGGVVRLGEEMRRITSARTGHSSPTGNG